SRRLLGFNAPSSTGTEVSASPMPKKRLWARLIVLNMLSNLVDGILHECRVGAVKLIASDTVIGNTTQIQIAAMFAHGGNHGVIFATAIPVRFQHTTVLVTFDDAAHIDIGRQPFVLAQAFDHAATEG